MKDVANFQIRPARLEDVPIILQLIRDLATYERAPHEVTATEEQLADFVTRDSMIGVARVNPPRR